LRVTDPSTDRWAALYREVRHSADPAWIFYDPDHLRAAANGFHSKVEGPFAFPESLFLARLGPLGVGYRIVHLGPLDAVVTSRAVDQQEVGMGPPLDP
jgi:hypothetical protein